MEVSVSHGCSPHGIQFCPMHQCAATPDDSNAASFRQNQHDDFRLSAHDENRGIMLDSNWIANL